MRPIRFIHLSGPRRGQTDSTGRLPATIGSGPDADVWIRGVAPQHAVVVQRGEDIILQETDQEAGTFLAGEQVQEAVLRDGDVLELGPGGPKLRCRLEGHQRVSLLQAMKWARPEGTSVRLGDTGAFARVLVSETALRTSRAFRLLLVATLLGGGLLFWWTQRESQRLYAEVAKLREAVRAADEDRRRFQGRVEEERQRSEADRRVLEGRIEEFRQREEDLSRRLAEAASGEVRTLKDELSVARGRLQTLESERAAGERIIRDYGAGVCLVQGSYAFYDAAGRPLRYRLDEEGHPVRSADGSLALDVEGAGEIHTVDYFGTGFLADRTGLVLTNRHIAEPWWQDATAQALARGGFRPRFVLFRAFFPRETQPFELDVVRHADKVDLALLRIDARRRKVPVVPLDTTGRGAVAGQPVVVVGYPTGLEAILAKADSNVVREILEAHGRSSQRVTEALSQKGLIRPSTTQGHIGDITKTDIVYDALSTQGGSGGPVLNKNGQVIAVEYAVHSKFGGNSFGVPVRYAIEILRPPKKTAARD